MKKTFHFFALKAAMRQTHMNNKVVFPQRFTQSVSRTLPFLEGCSLNSYVIQQISSERTYQILENSAFKTFGKTVPSILIELLLGKSK